MIELPSGVWGAVHNWRNVVHLASMRTIRAAIVKTIRNLAVSDGLGLVDLAHHVHFGADTNEANRRWDGGLRGGSGSGSDVRRIWLRISSLFQPFARACI